MPTQRLRDLYLLEQAGQLQPPEQEALKGLRDLGELPPPGDPAAVFPKAEPYAWFNRQAESAHGLPSGLLGRIQAIESSGGNPNAVSPTGVRGAYQITGRTGQAFGLDERHRGIPFAEATTAAKILAANLKQTGNLHDAVNLYAAPKDRAWYADKVLAGMEQPQPASTVAAPPPAPEPPTASTPSWPEAAGRTLGRGGDATVDALRQVTTNPRMLLRMLEGPSGLQEATVAGTTGALAQLLSPVLAPGSTAAGLGAETVARKLGASESAAQTTGTAGQIAGAATPLALAMGGKAAAAVPGVARSIYRSEFTPRAGRSFAQLGGGELPRAIKGGKFVPYLQAANLDDATLLARAQGGDSKLLSAFGFALRVGMGGELGGPLGALVGGSRLGRVGTDALGAVFKAALTNPATRPLTRQLLVSSADAPDFARMATVLAQHLQREQAAP